MTNIAATAMKLNLLYSQNANSIEGSIQDDQRRNDEVFSSYYQCDYFGCNDDDLSSFVILEFSVETEIEFQIIIKADNTIDNTIDCRKRGC